MKRIISIILTLAMCLSAVALLASCAAGESAYEIAVRHGYTGTEEEWYASLKGDKGDTGAAGAQGSKGDKGDKGETGDAGADGVKGDKGDKGETGDAGADGVNGTNGADGSVGREIEFNVTPDEIQWRYKGESEWKTLVTLDEIRGEKGDKGEEGDKGADGLTPTIGENGNWWIGNVDTGIYAGDKKEDGTAVVVKCTSLSFVEGACSIWATGTVPSLKIKYVLEDEAGNIVREGITNVTDGMLVGDYEFNGPDTYEDIVVKFLGFTSDPIDLTIDTTYDLVSPRVYAIGAEPVYQISKTVAGQEPEIITVTRDMIVKSNVDTSKAGKYSITINSPDGVPETFEIVVDGRIMSISQALKVATGTEVIISGTVTGFYEEWSSFNNCSPYITDEEGNTIIIFRTTTKVGLGDQVTVTGKIGKYNNKNQVAQGSKVTIDVPHVCTAWGEATCAKAPACVICGLENDELGEALGHNFEDGECARCGAITVKKALAAASGTKVTIVGTVVQIRENWNSSYKNMSVYIADEEGNRIQLYRIKTKVALNDIITVTGTISVYQGETQVGQGSTATIDGVHTCENFSNATCVAPIKCIVCGKSKGEALGHNYVDGVCDRCGEEEPNGEITFEFGANGSAAHVDGNDLGTSKSYTEGGVTLTLTGMSKVFGPAYDAKGNSCIKLGTTKVVGKFSFTVPDDVTSVVIRVAKYKANTTKINVNGTAYTINSASNNGQYDEIVIDTTTTKTITFTTVSGGARCMIDSITFVY